MADWTDHLTPAQAQAILDAPIKTRFDALNDRGEKIVRYSALSRGERARVEAKAREQL